MAGEDEADDDGPEMALTWDDVDEARLEEIPGEPELGAIGPDQFLIVRPGEDAQVAARVPRRRRIGKAMILQGGALTVLEGSRRSVVRTPASPFGGGPEAPMATRLVMVHARQRSTAPRTRPRLFVIVTDDNDRLLAWIDHSPPGWDFNASQLKEIASRTGLAFSFERFETEDEFWARHPGWVG